jgi:hypothetical protein
LGRIETSECQSGPKPYGEGEKMRLKEHDAVCQTVHDRIGKIVEDESQTVIMGRAADARQRDRDRERGEKEVP